MAETYTITTKKDHAIQLVKNKNKIKMFPMQTIQCPQYFVLCINHWIPYTRHFQVRSYWSFDHAWTLISFCSTSNKPRYCLRFFIYLFFFFKRYSNLLNKVQTDIYSFQQALKRTDINKMKHYRCKRSMSNGFSAASTKCIGVSTQRKIPC